MARRERTELNLPVLDELFTTQEERDDAKLKRIYDIPLSEIDDFPDHPFKVRDDEDMLALIDSIRDYGVLTPATLRKKEDGRYELLSGHRRKRACEMLGIETLRAEVVEMDRDSAIIFMVDSNLQRTTILPSEKGFSYKMRLEALKRKAGRPSKDNSAPLGPNKKGTRSNDELSEETGESVTQIKRYVRITELIPELIEMVDNGEISMRPAVELSYLPEERQYEVLDAIEMEACTPSHDQTLRMRKLLADDKLTAESILAIMQEEKPNQREKLVLRGKRIQELFPKNLPYSQREDYVIKAMEYYKRARQKQAREQSR